MKKIWLTLPDVSRARDFHEAQVGTKMKIKKMAKIDKGWDDNNKFDDKNYENP
jgi:hypothetical protein